jgi:hypothetical protein
MADLAIPADVSWDWGGGAVGKHERGRRIQISIGT